MNPYHFAVAVAVAVNLVAGLVLVRRTLRLARDNERLRRLVSATEVDGPTHARCRP